MKHFSVKKKKGFSVQKLTRSGLNGVSERDV